MSPASGARKLLRWSALVLFTAYGLRAAAVACMYLVPEARAVHAGSTYEIKRGFGRGFDYVPLVGLAPLLTGEPCRLAVTDQKTGVTRVEGYDLAIDVYAKYPQVWPEKQ